MVFPGSKSTVCCLWASRPHQHREISWKFQNKAKTISWLNNPEWPSLIRTLETTTKSNHGSVIDSCCTNSSMMFHAIPCRDVSSISLWQGLSMATSTWGDNSDNPMISNDLKYKQRQPLDPLAKCQEIVTDCHDSPNLVWMWHPKASHVHRLAGQLCQAVSGCVRLCQAVSFSHCVAHNWLTAAILGVSWVKICKNRGVYLPTSTTSTTSTSLTYWILLNVARTGRLTHSYPFGIQIAQPTVLPLSCILLLLHIH